MLKAETVKQCRKCPRLVAFREEAKRRYPDYFCLPVPALGADDAKIVIVGLAPGLHGANATGRPFTGDFAGLLLYRTLYRLGLSNQAEASALDDGLELRGCRITNAVKCVPPGNKPTRAEIETCAPYLKAELAAQPSGGVIIALGRIAHDAVLRALSTPLARHRFGHGVRHQVGDRIMWDSYHCSRYNTQTKRLTEDSFVAVFEAALREIL